MGYPERGLLKYCVEKTLRETKSSLTVKSVMYTINQLFDEYVAEEWEGDIFDMSRVPERVKLFYPFFPKKSLDDGKTVWLVCNLDNANEAVEMVRDKKKLHKAIQKWNLEYWSNIKERNKAALVLNDL